MSYSKLPFMAIHCSLKLGIKYYYSIHESNFILIITSLLSLINFFILFLPFLFYFFPNTKLSPPLPFVSHFHSFSSLTLLPSSSFLSLTMVHGFGLCFAGHVREFELGSRGLSRLESSFGVIRSFDSESKR